jgi:hypothetical protein
MQEVPYYYKKELLFILSSISSKDPDNIQDTF